MRLFYRRVAVNTGLPLTLNFFRPIFRYILVEDIYFSYIACVSVREMGVFAMKRKSANKGYYLASKYLNGIAHWLYETEIDGTTHCKE